MASRVIVATVFRSSRSRVAPWIRCMQYQNSYAAAQEVDMVIQLTLLAFGIHLKTYKELTLNAGLASDCYSGIDPVIVKEGFTKAQTILAVVLSMHH